MNDNGSKIERDASYFGSDHLSVLLRLGSFTAFDPIHATRIDEDDLPQLSSSIDEEVKRKATLPPKDDLPPVSSDKVHKHIRKLKTRKTLILD
ncbi:hypothetical protein EVAR_60035_1 [Eumeta japonica]|uniref:Uncharacterized protein n=1 Tax=Eumeta variegata TaxID=151549 RepID=A0A4C1ZJJ7_EUMVA|nr:hypothetical protein EVAR_60035_1 [Eumeta japonica]